MKNKMAYNVKRPWLENSCKRVYRVCVRVAITAYTPWMLADPIPIPHYCPCSPSQSMVAPLSLNQFHSVNIFTAFGKYPLRLFASGGHPPSPRTIFCHILSSLPLQFPRVLLFYQVISQIRRLKGVAKRIR